MKRLFCISLLFILYLINMENNDLSLLINKYYLLWRNNIYYNYRTLSMPIPSGHHNNDTFTSQHSHDAFVRKLAKNPGFHSGNITRQGLSNMAEAISLPLARFLPQR